METKDVIYELRTKKGLLLEELAEKLFVTRQAIPVGRTVKRYRIPKLSNCCRSCLMCRLTHSLARRVS